MLKGKLIYIFLFVSLLSFGQQRNKMLQASIQQAIGACTPDANEQFTTADATSDPNCNEANTASVWSGSINGTVTVVATPDTDGSYGAKHTGNGGVNNILRRDLTGNNGDTFDVTIWAKSDQGDYVRITGWTNCTGGPSNVVVPPDGVWRQYGPYSITKTSTLGTPIQVRGYSSASGSGVAGDNISFSTASAIKTN